MKVHYKNTFTRREEYAGSPHIIKAIDTGQWTLCSIGTDSITDNIDLVTCKNCLEKAKAIKALEMKFKAGQIWENVAGEKVLIYDENSISESTKKPNLDKLGCKWCYYIYSINNDGCYGGMGDSYRLVKKISDKAEINSNSEKYTINYFYKTSGYGSASGGDFHGSLYEAVLAMAEKVKLNPQISITIRDKNNREICNLNTEERRKLKVT